MHHACQVGWEEDVEVDLLVQEEGPFKDAPGLWYLLPIEYEAVLWVVVWVVDALAQLFEEDHNIQITGYSWVY